MSYWTNFCSKTLLRSFCIFLLLCRSCFWTCKFYLPNLYSIAVMRYFKNKISFLDEKTFEIASFYGFASESYFTFAFIRYKIYIVKEWMQISLGTNNFTSHFKLRRWSEFKIKFWKVKDIWVSGKVNLRNNVFIYCLLFLL